MLSDEASVSPREISGMLVTLGFHRYALLRVTQSALFIMVDMQGCAHLIIQAQLFHKYAARENENEKFCPFRTGFRLTKLGLFTDKSYYTAHNSV